MHVPTTRHQRSTNSAGSRARSHALAVAAIRQPHHRRPAVRHQARPGSARFLSDLSGSRRWAPALAPATQGAWEPSWRAPAFPRGAGARRGRTANLHASQVRNLAVRPHRSMRAPGHQTRPSFTRLRYHSRRCELTCPAVFVTRFRRSPPSGVAVKERVDERARARHVRHVVLDADVGVRLALPARPVRDERPRQQALAAQLEHLLLHLAVAALSLVDDALHLERVERLAYVMRSCRLVRLSTARGSRAPYLRAAVPAARTLMR